MKEWTTIDKSEWGEGPWQDEPDKVQWTDKPTGLPCLIVRNELTGSLCGYVGVEPGHPYHGKSEDDVELDAHGYGVNFSDECSPGETEATGICHVPEPGQSDDVWWFGFDCGHWRDLMPAMEATLNRLDPERQERWAQLLSNHPEPSWMRNTYKTVKYVQRECRKLAGQLAAVE